MKTRYIIIFILLILLALFIFINADKGIDVVIKNLDKNARAGRQYFLFIAIDKYQKWPALQKPVGDAKELKKIMTDRYFTDEVIELYNEKATKAEILKQMVELSGKTDINDSLFIYFSGHGHMDKNTNSGFWIPVNAGTDQFAQENWLPNTQIKGILKNAKALHICLVSDSCFSGDLVKGSPMFESNVKDYFKNAYNRISRQVLSSGASNETVPDESEFALQLKMYLERTNDPYIDPIMIFNQIRLGMSMTTPIYGEYKDLGQQEGGSFILFLKDKSENDKNEKKNG